MSEVGESNPPGGNSHSAITSVIKCACLACPRLPTRLHSAARFHAISKSDFIDTSAVSLRVPLVKTSPMLRTSITR
jgi:hypothetical protein